jgi:hypothetical protein
MATWRRSFKKSGKRRLLRSFGQAIPVIGNCPAHS